MSKSFTLKCEATKFSPAFEMVIAAPSDYLRNGPPLLMKDQEGNHYVKIGQCLNGNPDDFAYRLVKAGEETLLFNAYFTATKRAKH